MNLTDDHLRDALRVTADEIDTVRPLALPVPDDHPGRRFAGGRLRDSRWLPAVAAAAAVIAIAATAVAIGSGGHAQTSGLNSANPATVPYRGELPPYYVAIMTAPQGGLVTTLRVTRTGKVLATVQPPAGYSFIDAAPGSDDRTFLLEAGQHGQRLGLYVLRFRPSSRGTSLTRLPIPMPRLASGLAMSPGGTEIALATGTNTGQYPSKLQIFTLSGKLVRHWQDPGTICLLGANGSPCLSWPDSGYLEFSWTNGGTNVAQEGIWQIRASAASGSLLRASRFVMPFRAGDTDDFVLSGDGARIAVGFQLHSGPRTFYCAFEEFSAATGQRIGRFSSRHADVDGGGTVLWSDRTGRAVLMWAQVPSGSENPRAVLGILTTQGQLSVLPTPAGSWAGFAF
jgi:hypothetical protein